MRRDPAALGGPIVMTPPRTQPASATERLRQETSHHHDAVEELSFSVAVQQRQLPRSAYVGQLLAYRKVHDALDRALAGSTVGGRCPGRSDS